MHCLILTSQGIAVRLVDDGLLGCPEVEQGLRFLYKQLKNLHNFVDPRTNEETQQLWLACAPSLSELLILYSVREWGLGV